MDRIYFSYLVLFFSCIVGKSFSYPTPVDFSGKLLRWNIEQGSNQITYKIITDSVDVAVYESIAEDAAAQWNSVEGSLVALVATTEANEKITIYLTEDFSGNSHSAGYALFDGSDDNGPTHCKIEIVIGESINASFPKTLLHEMGHCLGLGHSLIPESVMSYDLEKNGYFLDIDDVAAISRLYPADGSKPELPIGCAVLAPGNSKKSNFLIFVLFLLPVLFSLFFRKIEGKITDII